ncbi:MAG TPA: hypothetical protein H9835_08765, partial [Candidatus Agathobaculum merdigallinarum]|nr:hypothetical protein [Candidatus Agathobaculum merdigallinarum]
VSWVYQLLWKQPVGCVSNVASPTIRMGGASPDTGRKYFFKQKGQPFRTALSLSEKSFAPQAVARDTAFRRCAALKCVSRIK